MDIFIGLRGNATSRGLRIVAAEVPRGAARSTRNRIPAYALSFDPGALPSRQGRAARRRPTSICAVHVADGGRTSKAAR
jgi:hypothetical protein